MRPLVDFGAMATCAIPSCTAERVNDNFCAQHGPKTRGKAPGAAPSRDAQIVCPHCQVKGRVRTSTVSVKQGVSGGKATGAVLTGGLSLFATGLSRKQKVTEAKCGNCGVTWHVA